MRYDEQKKLALLRVCELVEKFRRNENDYLRSVYNETQARTEFISPLLAAFGWDIYNSAGQPLGLREVVEEATVEVGEEMLSKKPDYELRLARQRKLFIEAKKPSVRLDRNRDASFQTRRYGYSASLPISILTNFHQLAIYDCVPLPSETDEAHVARKLLVRYDEFESRFDEIWPLLSRADVYSGEFDRRFAVDVTRCGAEQFDDFFLGQVRAWRERLAEDINSNTPGLTSGELTYAVQLFLSRIVFLRICEDREIEHYSNLKSLVEKDTFNALMAELRRADAFYDSGLFRLIDDERLGVRISDKVLQEIISDLYYPRSPYTFAVVETQVLGEIYEQFLGEVINVRAGVVTIESKPEVRDSGGVVPTPRYVVDAIVDRTLRPLLIGKSPEDLVDFTVADICCGSGIFLLSVYDYLLDHCLNWYIANDRDSHRGVTIYEVVEGQWRLTFEEKRRILITHVRGVDIDANAVEVACFSLLLKLIEDETGIGLRDYVETKHQPALPELDSILRSGNSLVKPSEWTAVIGPMPAGLLEKINPFDWSSEFPLEMSRGGFNVIVGNPPYIRIQNMVTYSPEEVKFYKNPASPYVTARRGNFDKYALFIERSLSLISADGRLGFIVPHKFMTIRSGRALREILTNGNILEKVVHFGGQQVFGRNISNYTCLLILERSGVTDIEIEHVQAIEAWRYGEPGKYQTTPARGLGADNWSFADADTQSLFNRVKVSCAKPLGAAAEIFVGVQTSADDCYIFDAVAESSTTVSLQSNGRIWPIEKSILRPCMNDVPLAPYSRAKANRWMIYPYEVVSGVGRTIAKLIQPTVLAARFPLCWAYLKANETKLKARNIVGGKQGTKQFYQFGRSQSLTKFNTPKIILPIQSLAARYAYDDNNITVTGGGNGPYYMIRPKPGSNETNAFLLAVLHHPLCEAMVRTNTSIFREGYYSHGKQFIEHLPVPTATTEERTTIESLVNELIAVNEEILDARTPHQRDIKKRRADALQADIETCVTKLYDLSSDDMKIVRAVPVPA